MGAGQGWVRSVSGVLYGVSYKQVRLALIPIKSPANSTAFVKFYVGQPRPPRAGVTGAVWQELS